LIIIQAPHRTPARTVQIIDVQLQVIHPS